ncbi:type VI secretion system baseplate subunit TssE [Geomonas sp. Red32]|uniref:type VI secretion system baseplate subunit TssE n=1 Tax=Geomonas sp. Red32 TaxID=2912856 RepID=UPI00202CD39F|nr:type VI secretion system baseplate subunit TssE [Geomonas sp. Red32]MCM0082096.1 type VI secretion system baseplate subunit TssE [Geomonas sp. Red32]
MHEERLLERIRSVEKEPQRRRGDDLRRGIRSLVSHLQRILNTRQGNVPIAGDYGVPDFIDFLQTFPESVVAIESSIRTAIEKYEPRLSNVNVAFLPDQDDVLTLRFQINANLTGEGGRRVCFETVVDADGKLLILA